jgi:hypothetical protein
MVPSRGLDGYRIALRRPAAVVFDDGGVDVDVPQVPDGPIADG